MKKIAQKILLSGFLSFSALALCQEKEIVKILNENLNQDLKITPEYNPFDDTLKIVKPYSITGGILSVELEIKEGNVHYTEKREVPLSRITAISKDIKVTFDTEDDAVTITENSTDKGTTTTQSNLFFTGIRLQTKNRSLGEALQKAFAKAGYKIELPYWYD